MYLMKSWTITGSQGLSWVIICLNSAKYLEMTKRKILRQSRWLRTIYQYVNLHLHHHPCVVKFMQMAGHGNCSTPLEMHAGQSQVGCWVKQNVAVYSIPSTASIFFIWSNQPPLKKKRKEKKNKANSDCDIFGFVKSIKDNRHYVKYTHQRE